MDGECVEPVPPFELLCLLNHLEWQVVLPRWLGVLDTQRLVRILWYTPGDPDRSYNLPGCRHRYLSPATSA